MAPTEFTNPFALPAQQDTAFKITEHIIECQHIREWPRATAGLQDDALHIVVKQYTPLSNLAPKVGDLTIIAMPANATPKEVYEPLWEDLVLACSAVGVGIRNIWMADMSHQGASFAANEKKIGNDPHWFDGSRDYLHMINVFRKEMVRPIVGIGHSLGTAQMVHLSIMHPRLLHSLVLVEPLLLSERSPAGVLLAKLASSRKELWPNQRAAEASVKNNPFYRSWDERALSRLVKHGFRDLPTLLYQQTEQVKNAQTTKANPMQIKMDPAPQMPVTLATPRVQEAISVLRPNYGNVDVETHSTLEQKRTHPDIPHKPDVYTATFYKAEANWAFDVLPSLRPSVLYMYGASSPLLEQKSREEKLAVTGDGFGGSGGRRLGLVKDVVVKGGHNMLCENVTATASCITSWLAMECSRWKENEEACQREMMGKSALEKQTWDSQWLEKLAAFDGKAPNKSARTSKL